MLPPIAILRERDWARDVTSVARKDWDRIVMLEAVEMLQGQDDGSYAAPIVDVYRYRRAHGSFNTRQYAACTGMTQEKLRQVSSGRRYEIDLAQTMEYFVEDGSRIALIGPELLSDIETDETADILLQTVTGKRMTVYVHYEGDIGPSPVGGQLDGFVIDYDSDFEDGMHVLVMPLSKEEPSPNDALFFRGVIQLFRGDGDVTISAAIREWGEALLVNSTAEPRPTSAEDIDPEILETSEQEEQRLDVALNVEMRLKTSAATKAYVDVLLVNADRWGRLIGGALRCLMGQGPASAATYAPGAPEALVDRASKGGTGARKVQQRLAAAGYPAVLRYENGNPVRQEPVQEEKTRTARQPTIPAETKSTRTPCDVPVRVDRRKARKLEKLSNAPVAKPPVVQTVEPGATSEPAVAATIEAVEAPVDEKTGIDQVGPGIHDADLLADIEKILMRSFKELPVLGSRNWESSLPPALASMIIRRTSVPRLPRETTEATRRRIAADIAPRLEGLPDLNRRLQTEHDANPDRPRALSIGRPSVVRDIDQDIADNLAHPVFVRVRGDDELQRLIRFAGVDTDTPGPNETARTTIVMAWREARTLHLVGYVHSGCLLGFRRVEVDLDDGEVATFDAEGDLSGPEDLADALYAPVADALLGPVDEIDAWQYARRAHRAKRSQPLVLKTIPVPDEKPRPAAVDWSPASIDFESWEGISRDVPMLTPTMRAAIDDVVSRNAVTRAAMLALDADTLEGDDEKARVRRAFTRLLASMASRGGRIDSLASPDIDEDVDLMAANDADGVMVISDRALFDHASPGLVQGRPGFRETPLCVFYRLRRDGISALIVQPTSDGHINLAQWTRMPVTAVPEDDDLSWYVRGAMAQVLLDRRHVAPVVVEDLRTLPTSRQLTATKLAPVPGLRQGPRRIVAQVRIMPENIRTAVAIAQTWFDDQAARHGERLVQDVREAGQWLIEHESDDRGVRSRWSVTLRLADTTPTAMDIVVRTTLATGVRPRLPTLVREIASAVPTRAADGLMHVVPPRVRTRSDLNELLRHLQSPDRVLPTLLMSIGKDGQTAFQPAEIAAQALGALNVRIVHDEITYDLAEALGQEYRTFGGAMRLFQPRFDPDSDNPSRHPRVMNDTQGKRAVSDLITRATAQTITRYDIPDTMTPPPAATTAAVPGPVVEPQAIDLREFVGPPTPSAAEIEAGKEASRLEEEKRRRIADEPPLPFDVPEAVEEVEVARPDAIRPFLGPVRPNPAALPELATAPEPPASPAAPSPAQPAFDIDELARRVASMVEASRPPAPQPSVAEAEEEAPPTKDAPAGPLPSHSSQTLPDVDLERRIEMAVASRFAALGVGDLVSAVTSLVGRMDDMIVARAIPAAVAAVAPAAVASATSEAEMQRLREELKAERDASNELLTEADAQRTAALAEVSALRRALNDRRRKSHAGAAQDAWPADLSGLADWLERNVLPNVVVTAKAYREMRKVPFTDMERLCRTLQLLDGPYVDMRAGEEGAKDRWDEGLKELRLQQKKQTRMGKGIRGGNEYAFEHEGVRWEMDYHIRGNESLYNEHERLLRIYYAYDKDEGRVLIGHMPTHLTTIDS